MEYWSDEMMGFKNKLFLFFPNTQYSTTPILHGCLLEQPLVFLLDAPVHDNLQSGFLRLGCSTLIDNPFLHPDHFGSAFDGLPLR